MRRALDGAGSPWLVLVREPDLLGVERAHPQLAFGVRLVELAAPNRHRSAPSLGNPRYTGSPESHPGSFHLDLRRSVTTIGWRQQLDMGCERTANPRVWSGTKTDSPSSR